MTDLTWILDPATGGLVVEGLSRPQERTLAGDLLPSGSELNCARPLESRTVPTTGECSPDHSLRIARIYHGSVVDGPGRRSVVQLQGCPIRCSGCYVPETHDPAGGVEMSVAHAVAAMLDRSGEPRDGMTVNGGEPFFQPVGLLTLLRQIKERGLHIVVYTGYTLEALARCSEVQVAESLHLTDLLIEGPFVAALSEGAGEWRGSRNQRLIANPASALASSPHTHKHGLSIARP